MKLIFNDLGTALSVKSCYSKFLNSIAVFLLGLLLSASFVLTESGGDRINVEVLATLITQN